jgi:Flp pilus assembly protein TadG
MRVRYGGDPNVRERGSALVLFTVVLSMLMVMCAGLLDLGLVRVARGELQRTADAAALAGVSGMIDGDPGGDTVRSRAIQYVGLNPVRGVVATIETLEAVTDLGTVRVVLGYQTVPLFIAPAGVRLTASAGAQVKQVTEGITGRPAPPGNAFGWYTKVRPQQEAHGVDSVHAQLTE